MGQLLYGSPPAVFEIDDRTLAHIEIVVLAKLRRNESFALSVSGEDDDSRSSIWLNPASVVQFTYANAAQPINREWLEQLMDSANTASGLRLTPEPTKDDA